MALTKADLRDRVGSALGLVQEGAALTGPLAVRIEDAIEDVHEMLLETGVAHWDTSAIPQYLALPLRDFVASKVAQQVGADDSIVQHYAARERTAYRDILRLLRPADGVKGKVDRSLLLMSAPRRRYF